MLEVTIIFIENRIKKEQFSISLTLLPTLFINFISLNM